MPMYNLTEYCNNYSKTSGSLWQYFRDKPAVNVNCAIVEFNKANPTKYFISEVKIPGQTENNGVEKMLK